MHKQNKRSVHEDMRDEFERPEASGCCILRQDLAAITLVLLCGMQ